MRTFVDLLKRFRDDERGIFAVIFGVMAIVLVAMAGAAVDYTSMEMARTRAQLALDSAALGLTPAMYGADVTEETLVAEAQNLVIERVNDPNVTIDIDDAQINRGAGTLTLSGRVTVPMAFVQLVGIPSLSANLMSEVTRSSVNIEVAVALDNTGSMEDYIDDLKTGLNGLIDIVVSDVQEPTFSKMALAPYAAALNVGSNYAADVRGAIQPPKTVTNFVWSGALLDITLATKANPVVVTTATNHGYSNGDIVYINGVTGMTQLNGKFFKVANKNNTTFQLQATDGTNVNGTGYGTFTGAATNANDKVRKCLYWIAASSACQVVVNANDHGFATGDYIRVNDTTSGTYNNKFFSITRIDNNSFKLDSTNSTSSNYPLSTGGNAYCTNYLCEYYRFTKSGGGTATYRVTTCVSERATDTYSEVPPSTTLMGAVYTSAGACDLDQTITPLTTDRDVLHAEAEKMDDHGNTAGHLGTAWAWYLLSPDWGYLWDDEESVPVDYDYDNLLKIAIIMTDGVYNQQYCNGVISSAINCTSPDTSTNQARALCAEMKEAGIIVYTVGFNVSGSSAETTMTTCATDASKAFLPETGEELVEDFRTIGQQISDLRLSM